MTYKPTAACTINPQSSRNPVIQPPIGQLLLGIKGGLEIITGQGIGIYIGRMVLIAVCDLKGDPISALPIDGAGGGGRRGRPGRPQKTGQ